MVSCFSLVWFFLKDIVFDIYDLIYTEQSIGSFHFIVINYLFAFVTFLTLNILNYGVANYLAKKIFEHPAARSKMSRFFYILGIFLIFSIALKISKVDLQNFIYS